MAVDIALHTTDGPYVAFSIDYDLYFMRLEPVPRVYDGDLKPQVIPNLDSWFQAKTHQRHSLQSFRDMVGAFAAGLARSYSVGDLSSLAATTALATKLALLDRMGEYGRYYWIEVLDPAKLETVWAENVRLKFDGLRARLGDDGFHNYLCRLWKFAVRHRPRAAAVFEKFIRRLGREPQDPVLPGTVELDGELVRSVLAQVLTRETPHYKGVPKPVQDRLEILNGRSSPGTV